MSEFAIKQVLEPLIKRADGINEAFRNIAKKLDYEWTWKYLYHVYRGTAKPSQKLIRKLKALKKPKPRKRNRVHTEALTDEQKANWMKLTMEQRREALDRMFGEIYE